MGEMIRTHDPNLKHAPDPNYLIEQYRSRDSQEKRQRKLEMLVSSGALAGIVIGAVLAGTETSTEIGIGLMATSAVVGPTVSAVIRKSSSS